MAIVRRTARPSRTKAAAGPALPTVRDGWKAPQARNSRQWQLAPARPWRRTSPGHNFMRRCVRHSPVVCRHNSVRQQIHAVRVGPRIDRYNINQGSMILLSVCFLTFFNTFLCSHCSPGLEILVLRQQLGVLKRRNPRPPLRLRDRLFWVLFYGNTSISPKSKF